jgi:methionine aminotransferase
MSLLAKENNAINLSQGFPDFPIDVKLKNIISQKIQEDTHQYCPASGHPELLEGIAQVVKKSYHRDTNIGKEILVTAGATQAIFTAIQAVVHPGDEVLILDPSYDCYVAPVLLCNAKPVRVSLDANFMPDWESIQKKVTSKTKLIITNNPHNPSGKTWTKNDMNQLELLLDQYKNLHLLSDEVYEFITFENKHLSAHRYESLHKKSIIVSSFGKTLHVTGWKIGYVIADEKIMNEIKKIHQYMVFCVNSMSQHVIGAYLSQDGLKDINCLYEKKRDLFRKGIENSRFKLLPCEGTYFQTLSYEGISNLSDIEFSEELTKKHGVAAIPISVFSQYNQHHKMIRFCFAKENSTLKKASDLLCKI